MPSLHFLIFLLAMAVLNIRAAAVAEARVLTVDTLWSGDVTVEEDVLIPRGVTLRVAAGTKVIVKPSESTKIDPEYLSHQTEITVRGELMVEGTSEAPVSFQCPHRAERFGWAGVIIDGGSATVRHGAFHGAEAAFHVVGGKLSIEESTVSENRYGIIGQGETAGVVLRSSSIRGNEYGVLALNGASVQKTDSRVEGNSRKDWFALEKRNKKFEDSVYKPDAPSVTRAYGEETIVGETAWTGHILVTGMVRVAPEARLVIMPGTVVSFSRLDTNGDGIGENGLMIQGLFLAKGTVNNPILFRSNEKDRRGGDWDGINIMGSELGQNLMEYVQIEDAYRGIHFHFSNVAVNQAILRNNYRGAQFQESLVVIKNSRFHDNKSALQARDSEVVFSNNRVHENLNGANFFRVHLDAKGNRFSANMVDGLRIREGEAVVVGNRASGNRFGLLVADATHGRFDSNLLANNLEAGLSLRDCDHLTISGNIIEGNGINGIGIRDTRAEIRGNLIGGNGEHGLGILSFSGVLRDNSILHNGLYAVGLEGEGDVDAAGNWWGGSDLDKVLYDRRDEKELGEVRTDPVLEKAPGFSWDFSDIDEDLYWGGNIQVTGPVKVAREASLVVWPGSRIVFPPGGGMEVTGTMTAEGTGDAPIVFTSAAKDKPGDWNEIWLEHAEGTRIAYCHFSNATWGLHVHFSPITISASRFWNNDGGIRFRGGPMIIEKNSFRRNRIGIRSNMGVADVTGNEFRENEIGIFVSNKGGGLRVHRNDFASNTRYAIRLGDFNADDVNARENWWDGKAPADLIFDDQDEQGVGAVLYEPPLQKAVFDLAGPAVFGPGETGEKR